ncbi:MAG: DNA polymerase III subunit gamma/tau [Alphaproteobacteria bacterium]|nr:DNA polymerase III subunit gamma/tau [Alphaproteobacteria bacterium]
MSDSMFDDAETGAGKPYVVLARKYRPQTFADLIGQDAMVATLKNAFEQGRIAQGYMLTGVRGVGKTTTARILARALNFEPMDAAQSKGSPTIELPHDPAKYGRHCAEIMESRHADVVEMDAASNTGVDNMREIIESARYKPLLARYKVFIIDEVHMLSKGAFNALLKTLEEPPEHVKFIFATTEIRKVPVTVLSRCQRFDLRRVDVPGLSAHFRRIVSSEGAEAEDEALMLIARAAEGSVRDGLSILDQAIAYSKGKVRAEDIRTMLGLADRGRIFDLLEALIGAKPGEALKLLEDLHRDGADPVQALGDLSECVHLATRIKTVGAEAGSEGLSAEEVRRAGAIAGKVSIALLSRVWQMLLKGIEETGRAPNPRAAAEMVLIRIAYTADLPSPEEIVKTLGGASVPVRRAIGEGAKEASETTAARAKAPDAPAAQAAQSDCEAASDAGRREVAGPQPVAEPPPPWEDEELLPDGLPGDGEFDPEDPLYADAPLTGSAMLMTDPASFLEVVEVASAQRDAKLKVHLEENVSLVKFDREARAIDIFLMPNAPPQIANELREKLNLWTGKRWMVMLSKSQGETPVGQARREAAATELERLKSDPTVAAALAAFPGARVAAVRTIETDDDTDSGVSGTGASESGTG